MAEQDVIVRELGFDPQALRDKYRAERDKRLRADGADQYASLTGRFAHFRDDPFAIATPARPALSDAVDVVIIGGGFAGLMTAARLRKAGIDDIRIVEAAGDFGGTWYWNRYPGAACDVESYIYLPLLEEIGYVPTEKYAKGPEIRRHCEAIARHFDLYRHALFQTRVTALAWDEAAARWTINTDRGDALKARFVCLATGPISRPKLPGIKGVERFKGHSFHTCRWDYAYTGGSPAGDLTGLKDKRVAIIGTSATAVQCIPHLGASAGELLVVQRTPTVVDLRDNQPTDPDWAATLGDGWQKQRMENFEAIVSGLPRDEDLVNDMWTDLRRTVINLTARQQDLYKGAIGADELLQLADFQKMEQIRARVSNLVDDAQTAEAMKPWYNLFCKRPTFHDQYYQTFNRPNVRLLNSDGRGVEEITDHEIIVAGERHAVDCIIYATGFEVQAPAYRAGGFDIIGVDGLSMADKWADRIRSLHGMQSRGFPNLFMLGVALHGAATLNVTLLLEEQSAHLVHIIRHLKANAITRAEVSHEAEARWGDAFDAKTPERRAFLSECTPSYFNNEGKVDGAIYDKFYGGGAFEYFDLLRAWREDGLARDLELTAR